MILDRAFGVLEIEQTIDKKKIKKAYARMVKQYHPEEFPEKWKVVHDAYETAIKWADSHTDMGKVTKKLTLEQIETGVGFELKKDKKKGEDRQEKSKEDRRGNSREDRGEERQKEQEKIYREIDCREFEKEKKEEITRREEEKNKRNEKINSQDPEQKNENDEELINIFDNIEELALENSRKALAINREKLQSALDELERLGKNGMFRLEEWKALFNNANYEWAACQEAFVDKWGDVLAGKRINYELYQFMKEKLNKIKETTGSIDSRKISEKKRFLYTINYTEMKIDSAYRRYTERSRRLVIVALSISILLLVTKAYTSNTSYTSSSGRLNDYEEQTIEEFTQEMETNTENLERIWRDTKDRGMEMSLTLLISSDDEKRQEWFERSQYVYEGIYLLDARDIPTGYEKNYGGMEPREYSITEVPAPDWLRDAPDMEFLTEDIRIFYIAGFEENWGTLLWCDPEVLGFDGDCRIYSKTDYGYVEMIPKEEAESGMEEIPAYMQRYEVLGYQVFSVNLPVELVIVASK